MVKSLLIAGAAVIFTGPVIGLAVLTGAGGATGTTVATAAALCVTSGPVAGLDATQARNARTIVAATLQTVTASGQSPAAQARAELVALMTAETESTLHDYANPLVPASGLLPNDGMPSSGGDHDSVGLFQQRASWGPLSERMDPAASSRLFAAHLLALPGWQTLPPGVAAQTVQRSAFPDRYAVTEARARRWLEVIVTSAAWVRCGGDGLPAGSGLPIKPGALPPGYAIPADATDAERRAVTFALAQLGKPYVFGAAGPASYDCSGLTMAAWAAAGVVLPHYTVAQYAAGVPVATPSLLRPGDLIFIPGSDGSVVPPNPQHVGLYLGQGLVIEAPQTGDVVKVVPLAGFGPIIGLRHYG